VLITELTFSASATSAQSKFQIVQVDQILTIPGQCQGQIVALHGIAGTLALEERTFTVLDSKSSKVGESNGRFIWVTFAQKSQMIMPTPYARRDLCGGAQQWASLPRKGG